MTYDHFKFIWTMYIPHFGIDIFCSFLYNCSQIQKAFGKCSFFIKLKDQKICYPTSPNVKCVTQGKWHSTSWNDRNGCSFFYTSVSVLLKRPSNKWNLLLGITLTAKLAFIYKTPKWNPNNCEHRDTKYAHITGVCAHLFAVKMISKKQIENKKMCTT